MLEINTKLGDIRFSRNVIKRIINDAVDKTEGRVYLHRYRGKINMPATSNVEILDKQEGLEITLYVVIKFGSSIRKNARAVVDYIYDKVESVMGEKPGKVTMIITGVESKDIARRNIEISR